MNKNLKKEKENKKDEFTRYLKEIKLIETEKENPIQGQVRDPKDLVTFMRDLQNSSVPKAIVVLLDENLLSLGHEIIAIGQTPNNFDIGIALQYYLIFGAKKFIVIVNHVNSDATPTEADKKAIQKLQVDCQTLSFKPEFQDYIIVGDKNTYWSMSTQDGTACHCGCQEYFG
jgi:DNA repair protein RadC